MSQLISIGICPHEDGTSAYISFWTSRIWRTKPYDDVDDAAEAATILLSRFILMMSRQQGATDAEVLALDDGKYVAYLTELEVYGPPRNTQEEAYADIAKFVRGLCALSAAVTTQRANMSGILGISSQALSDFSNSLDEQLRNRFGRVGKSA